MPGWLTWLVQFVLKGLGFGPKPGPSADNQVGTLTQQNADLKEHIDETTSGAKAAAVADAPISELHGDDLRGSLKGDPHSRD